MVQEQMRACDMLPKYAGVDARYQCTQFSCSEEFGATGGGRCARSLHRRAGSIRI